MRDTHGKARILARLRSASLGYFGDCKALGDGISEMQIHSGPGYRVYFMRFDTSIYVLLMGGDKDSQQKDILRARDIAHKWRENQ